MISECVHVYSSILLIVLRERSTKERQRERVDSLTGFRIFFLFSSSWIVGVLGGGDQGLIKVMCISMRVRYNSKSNHFLVKCQFSSVFFCTYENVKHYYHLRLRRKVIGVV